MTGVRFLKKENRLCGFEITGHSTENAEDTEGKTVCAAVSSAAYMAANTVTEIVGDSADSEVNDGRMYFFVKTPSDKTETVLEGFKLHISELAKQYGKRIRIITEVK